MAGEPQIERRPIADAIEGVPTPGEHSHLFGHEAGLAQIRDAVRGDRLHHAWLLAGPRGIGKATFAFDAAARLLGSEAPDDAVRRQIAQGAHPGLLHISRSWDEKAKRFKTQIAVDDVRRTLPFFGMTASGGARRVCIVDPADDMSIGAANALLKVLEEPPKGAVFFIISHSPGRLLPTIRSRCRTLQLTPLGDEAVGRTLSALASGTDESAAAAAVAVANGAPRQAFLALQGDVLARFERFKAVAGKAAKGTADWQAAHALADGLSSRAAVPESDQFFDLVQAWIAEQARAGGNLASLARWATLWERTAAHLDRARTFNLDRKQLVLDLFADLFETVAPRSQDQARERTR